MPIGVFCVLDVCSRLPETTQIQPRHCNKTLQHFLFVNAAVSVWPECPTPVVFTKVLEKLLNGTFFNVVSTMAKLTLCSHILKL